MLRRNTNQQPQQQQQQTSNQNSNYQSSSLFSSYFSSAESTTNNNTNNLNDESTEDEEQLILEEEQKRQQQFEQERVARMVLNASRDRTSEFQSTIRSFQSRQAHSPQQQIQQQQQQALLSNDQSQSSNSTSNKILSSKEAIQRRNVFTRSAKTIGRELTNTCIKLEKLTELVKRKSLFDDKPKEIEDLTYAIKQDLMHLQSSIGQLQSLNKTSQSQKDGKNMQKHSFNVVYTLQSKLANVSNVFKSALETRNENFRSQTERGEQFFSKNTLNPSKAASVFAPPQMPGSNMGRSVLLYQGDQAQTSQQSSQNEQQQKQPGGGTVLNMDLMQKQKMQQRLIVNEEETFLKDRANAMQTVESTIIELGGMFQSLATMIKEQDEAITRIDSNVEDVDVNVSEAHTELLKYFQSVTSNRWLMIKIFGILIVFFVFFVVVMT